MNHPGIQIYAFFEALKFELETEEHYNFLTQKLGIIADSPYFEFLDLKTLHALKKGLFKERFLEIMAKLFYQETRCNFKFNTANCTLKEKEEESLKYSVILTRFNYFAGAR